MAKIKFILFALFVCMAAHAQKIEEKDLLGTWKLAGVYSNGMIMDFKTGKASIDEGYEYDYTPEDVKYYEEAMKGTHPFPVSFTFLKNKRLEIKMSDSVHTVDGYTLESGNVSSHISFEGKSFEVELIKGILYIIGTNPEDGSEIEMSYTK